MRLCTNCGREYPQAHAEPGCNMCPYCRSARDLGKSYGKELVKSVAGAIRGLLRALPDSTGDECWKWCWNELDELAQGFVKEMRAKGEAALKALESDEDRHASKRPPIPAEVAAQLDRDQEIYGNAFIHLSGGKWRRLDPIKMVEDVGGKPAPVPRHQFTPVEGDSVLCVECGLPATNDVHF